MKVRNSEESALCHYIAKAVRDYFKDDEHLKEFKEWYKLKYGIEYRKKARN